jgi:cell division protein FtsZ
VNYLTEAAGEDVNIIFGTVDNETLGDEVSITIIATGIEAGAKKNAYGSFGQAMGVNNFAKPAATPVQPVATPVQPVVQPTVQTPVQPVAQTPVQPQQTAQTTPYRQPVPVNQQTQTGFSAGQATPSYSGQPIATPQPKTAAKPSFLNGAQGSAGGTASQAAPVTTARPQPPKQEADGSIKIPEFLKRR